MAEQSQQTRSLKVREIQRWLEERLPVSSVFSTLGTLHLARGASFQHTLGMVALFLFLLQCLIGTVLASYYSASATDAWSSTAYIQDTVAAGWVMRGLHHHGMSALVVVCILHFVSVVFRRAYDKGREIVWLSGLGMLALVGLFSLTGYTLTFDQNAYWATQVRMGITASLPGGDVLNRLVFGGGEFGNLSITRNFVAHAILLPGAVIGLLILHVVGFWRRQQKIRAEGQGAAQESPVKTSYWGYQWLFDSMVIALVTVVIVMMTVKTHGAPLGAPAEPNSNFVARPEWFFLFLFEMLHHFDGPTRMIGTIVIPGAVASFLVAVPWLGRKRMAGHFMTLGCMLILGGWAGLTSMAVVKDNRNPEFAEAMEKQAARAQEARTWAKQGVLAQGGPAVFHNDPEYVVRKLYADNCAKCHSLDPKAKPEAPTLLGYANRAWLTDLIRNPNAPRFFGATKHRDMDPYPVEDLSDADLKALVEYLVSLGRTEIRPANQKLVSHGATVFEDQSCDSCHEVEKGSEGDAPNLWGHGNVEFVAAMIRNPKHPLLFGDAAEMPGFANDLSDDEIKSLAEFVVQLRSVAKAE